MKEIWQPALLCLTKSHRCCWWCGRASRSNWLEGCGSVLPYLAVRLPASHLVYPPLPPPRCPTRCFLMDTRRCSGGWTRWRRSSAERCAEKWVWSPAVLFKHLYLRIFKLLKYKVLCCKSTWLYMYVSCWVKHTCMTIIKELSSCLLTWCFCEDMMWNVQLCPTISCNKYKEYFQKFPDLDQEHLHKLISSKLE